MKRLFAVLFAVLLILSACGSSEYSEIKNPERYSIDAKKLNSRLSAEYELKAGDDISVELSVEKGEFYIVIASDTLELYSGSGGGLEGFSVTAVSDGIYTISVEGRNAVGALSFSFGEKTE